MTEVKRCYCCIKSKNVITNIKIKLNFGNLGQFRGGGGADHLSPIPGSGTDRDYFYHNC